MFSFFRIFIASADSGLILSDKAIYPLTSSIDNYKYNRFSHWKALQEQLIYFHSELTRLTTNIFLFSTIAIRN